MDPLCPERARGLLRVGRLIDSSTISVSPGKGTLDGATGPGAILSVGLPSHTRERVVKQSAQIKGDEALRRVRFWSGRVIRGNGGSFNRLARLGRT